MQAKLEVNIPAKSGKTYPILIEANLLRNWQSWLDPYCKSDKIVVITDSQIAKLYGEKFCDYLEKSGYQVKLLAFPHGEQYKNAETKYKLEEQMFAFGCDRHTLCIALGGGVVGDITGFTAATYMRGINFIQIPTSLLAMIDSSVGGKTGINASYGKNVIGAFWQPKAVIMDLELLKSLPREQVINGFFEAVKIFLTLDKEHFEYCSKNLEDILSLDSTSLTKVLYKAVALKAHVVEVDEEERNLRMILNYGHTVGHALEKLANYEVLHGYAVGLGMLVEAKIAELMGLLSTNEYNQIHELLSRLGLPVKLLKRYPIQSIVEAMRGDKKNRNQEIVMVLLSGIGQVKNINNKVAFQVDEKTIIEAVQLLQGN